MLLVDALYVNNSGGLELLKYLVNVLEKVDAQVFYLLDARILHIFSGIEKEKCLFLKATTRNRIKFYYKNRDRFSKVFCFGNIPPPIRLKSIVYTYFHNINLLKIPEKDFSLKIPFLLKQKVIYAFKNNTTKWIVQTSNTRNELNLNLNEPIDKILVLPFWEENQNCISLSSKTDYIYVANYTPQKQHLMLIQAWRKLYTLGYNLCLHLTLSNPPTEIQEEIELALNEGVKIINHGHIDRTNINSLYSQSKAIIYTSLNESFGLGIIEALFFNCDVIGPDLPYIHSICKPSSVFSSFEIDDLLNAIIKYEKKQCLKSELSISNQIKEIINLLV